jgi:hypothetical protein
MFFLNSDIMVFLFSVKDVVFHPIALRSTLSPHVRCPLPELSLAEQIPLNSS